jgi:odorant receptor
MWFCGLEVFKKDYKWFNLRLSFFAFLIVNYFINSAYTCYTNNLETSLQWLATFSFSIQGVPKLWVVCNNHQDLIDIINEIEELCQHILKKGSLNSEMNWKLDRCGKGLQLMYFSYSLFSLIGILIIMAYPILMFCLDGGFHFIIPLFIPFLDRDTPTGYTITLVYHLIAVFLLLNFTLVMDFLFFCAVASYAMQVELMCDMNQRLNDYLESIEALRHDKDKQANLRKLLVEILKKHQNIKRMIERLNDMFFWPITCQMTTSVVSLSISLFLMITVSSCLVFENNVF